MPDSIHVKLPDGSEKEVPKGTTALEVAKSISQRLADAALAAKTNGDLIDLTRPLDHDTETRIITQKDPEALDVYRHSPHHRKRTRGARRPPPFLRAPAGRRRARTLPRDQVRPRPRHRERILLRLLSPYRVHSRRPRKDRKENAGARPAEPALRARISAAQRGPEKIQGRRRLHEVPLHRAIHQA